MKDFAPKSRSNDDCKSAIISTLSAAAIFATLASSTLSNHMWLHTNRFVFLWLLCKRPLGRLDVSIEPFTMTVGTDLWRMRFRSLLSVVWSPLCKLRRAHILFLRESASYRLAQSPSLALCHELRWCDLSCDTPVYDSTSRT